VALADLNGDKNPDIVTTNSQEYGVLGTVSVLLGNGDATFRAPESFTVGGIHPLFISGGDVNRDNKPDIVTANFNSNTVSVLLGNGDGTLQAPQMFGVGVNPSEVKVADLQRRQQPRHRYRELQ